tara:strand:+ start:1698 stop:2519 length:822 start_codon:yes stop_codon:yes gene_type:complete
MKSRIKKILREQSDVVPEVPSDWAWVDGERAARPIPSKNIFFKVVKQIALSDPGGIMVMDDSSYDDRAHEMSKVLKLFAINTSYMALINKIFWAANDNMEGLKNGSINSFDDLSLRQSKQFRVECSESWTEHIYYNWAPIVDAYSEDDAMNEVYQDEDGLYQYYEWENEPGFSKDVGDVDAEGKDIENIVEIGNSTNKRAKANYNENKLIGSLIKENSWQVTDDDKWNKLEKDLRYIVERLIEKHKDNWGGDQYAVMGAIEQVLEGMYQKVGR